MFGIGFAELVVIFVVVLLVLGPEGLPKAAKMIGRFTGELRKTADEFKSELYGAYKESDYQAMQDEIKTSLLHDDVPKQAEQNSASSVPSKDDNSSEEPEHKEHNDRITTEQEAYGMKPVSKEATEKKI